MELNGHLIWREDIALGGDGWERIEIDWKNDLDLDQGIQIINDIKTDGTKNVLTFSIAMDASIATDKVKGLLVWIDDVYLKSYDTPENLIKDGSVELCKVTAFTDHPTADCSWYQSYNTSFNCCPLQGPQSSSNFEFNFYPDGSSLVQGAGGVPTQADITMKERRSGNHSIVLKVPALDPLNGSGCTVCSVYGTTAPGIIISAATDIDFRGLLGCDYYTTTLPYTYNIDHYEVTQDLSNSTYLLDKSVTISGDVLISGCAVAIKPGVTITIPSGSKLTITSDVANNEITYSNLFACTDMWDGIVIEPGGMLDIYDGTTIADAITAVRCLGNGTIAEIPTLHLNALSKKRIVFDHNRVDLEILNDDYSSCYDGSGNYAFRAHSGGTFTDRTYWAKTDFICTNGMIAKPPMQGIQTYSHIILKDAKNVIAGTTYFQNLDRFNLIEDSQMGIMAMNSDLTVYQSYFKNIGMQEEVFENSGIYSSSENPVILKVNQTGGDDYKNTFTNCSKGINAIGDIQTSIIKNDFHNNGLDVLLSYNSSQSISIQDNSFDSAFNSIMLFDNTTQQLITVTGNHLKSRHDEAGVPAGDHGIGIYYAHNAKLNMNIDQNELLNFPLGIRIINADKLSNSVFNVTQNTINFNFDESRLGENLYRGIFMSNSSGVKLADNTITWNSGLTNPVDINSHAEQVMGMRLEKVQTSDIKDNTVTTCGTGMLFYDDCSGTYFTCNNFQDNYPGIEFSQTTLPPAQGGPCQPAFNTWSGTYNAAFPKNIATGICSPFDYYYSGALSLGNPENPLPGPFIITPFNIGNCAPINPCTNNHNGNLMADDTTKKDEELEKIVDQPAPNPADDFSSETEYKKQEYAYSTMLEIPALVNSAERVDFMDSIADNNIGKLEEVKELILAGDTILAVTMNNSIIDTNLIESNKKTVNNINFISPDTLPSSDSIVANGIAHQIAVQGGEAVYWMRGRLRKDIEDVLPAMRKTKIFGDEPKPTVHGKLFPIPANESVTFTYEHPGNKRVNVILADALGQVLKNYFLNNNRIEFSVSHLANGFYYIKVSEDGIEIEEHKLTINR